MAEVTFRYATSSDINRILEIVNAVAGDEAVALMGSEELALQYDEGLVRLDPIPNKSRVTVLAMQGDKVVGVLQYQFGDAPHHSRFDVLKVLFKVLGPVRLVRRLPAIRSRLTVDIPVPTDSLFITNFHVDASVHGQGVGTQMLVYAEAEAHRIGARNMSLTTIPTYIAGLKLYERYGFKVTKTVTSPSYEKYTGIKGRVFLEKQLDPVEAEPGA